MFSIFIVITLTFFVMRAIPGGPFVGEKATTPAAQELLEAKYGLDKPTVTVRYKTANSEGFLKIGSSIVGTKYYFTVDDVNVYTMDTMDAGLFFALSRA